MAIAARQMQNDYAYMPATRVYSHAAVMRAVREEKERSEREAKREARAAQNRVAREAALRRFFMIVTVAVAAAAMLLVLIRYSQINNAYAEVNRLKTEIESTKLEIKSLNVELNSAVSLEEARDAATEAGLGYPKADQIIKVDPYTQNGKASGTPQIEVLP
ncbi:MAG: hypothetical protein PHC80_07300 [Eubacteriales bacterium]|nr:hypothetical protein [Eubacteriales bacterium]